MRRRFNSRGLVSRTNPNGKSDVTRENRLSQKFKKGDISQEEMRELACFMALSRKQDTLTTVEHRGNTRTIVVWGKLLVLTEQEYQEHCRHEQH